MIFVNSIFVICIPDYVLRLGGIHLLSHYIYHLKSLYLFQNLSDGEIKETLQVLEYTPYSLRKWELLCIQKGDPSCIYIVLEGKIEIAKSGIYEKCLPLKRLVPYECFNENISSCQCIHNYTLTALEDSKLLILNLEKLLVCPNAPTLMFNLIKYLEHQNLILKTQIEYSKITPLKKRVATFLYNYSVLSNSPIFTIPYNREEMASYLSVTRPALSKVLAQFKEINLIDYYKDSFKINDLETLKKQ